MIIPFASFNFEHDSSMTFEYEGELHSFEFERVVGERYHSWADTIHHEKHFQYAAIVRDSLLKHFGVSDIQIESASKYIGMYWKSWDDDKRSDQQIDYLLNLLKTRLNFYILRKIFYRVSRTQCYYNLRFEVFNKKNYF